MKTHKKRLCAVMWSLTYIGIYTGISILVQDMYVLWLKAARYSGSEIFDKALSATFALTVISSVLSLWIYAIVGFLRKKPIGTVIKTEKTTAATVMMTALAAIGARMVINAYTYAAQNIPMLKKSIDDAAALSPVSETYGQMLAALLSMLVIAPVFEEILFRGLVLGELCRVMRPWAAVGVQAVLFGVCHGVLFQSLFAAAVGVLLGFIYLKTESIKCAAVCHGIFNLSAVTVYFAESAAGAAICLCFGTMLVLTAVFYIAHERKS